MKTRDADRFLALNEDLQLSVGLEAFWQRIVHELAVYGVRSILYGVVAYRAELDIGPPTRSVVWKSNHPPQFVDTFSEEALLDDDLSCQHCIDSSSIFFWHDDSLWDTATPEQKRRARIERDLGLDVGVTIPSSHFTPGTIGGVGVSMAEFNRTSFTRAWERNQQAIVRICGMLDIGMRQQRIAEVIALSPREKECLTWLAVGLRPEQIADKLAIRTKTVDKFIVSARAKLKAATRDQAVAKALYFNVIQP